MKLKDSTDLRAIASDLPESDLDDLKSTNDALCAIRRKIVSIEALIQRASSYAENLGNADRVKQDECRVVTLVFELEARIENVLTFVEAAEVAS